MRKMRTGFTAILAMLMVLTLSLASCSMPGGSEQSGDSGVEYVIRLGHSDTKDIMTKQ